jgi:DNA-binding transcriptional MerR regulator
MCTAATVNLPPHWKVKRLRIGELSRRSGVPSKTVRYYEGIGLLEPPSRTASGYRTYPDAVLDRLAFIRSAQALGLTLGEIRSIIALRDNGEVPCAHVVKLLENRTEAIESTIRQLKDLRSELRHIVDRSRHLDPADCDAGRVCHLITPR